MTELLDIGPGELEIFGFEEKSQAYSLKEEVDSLLDEIHGHEKKLGSSYVKLGRLLGEVDRQRAWIPWGYTSLAGYITAIKDRIGRERSQIFEMISVAQRLLPQVSEADLEAMGISRASLLKKFVVQSQRRVTPELLAAALDCTVTVANLKQLCYSEMNQKQDPLGTWYDLSGFYVSPDEKLEMKRGFELARRVDPPTDPNLPEHYQRKDCVLKWVREFIGTYEDGK
jgi:hypothetical protein